MEFLAWYDSQKSEIFDNRRFLESFCRDDVPVVRQACRVFRREFMHTGNIDVFIESITIASACYKVLRKRFLQPDTIGLMHTGGYTCNNNYNKKALMWLLHTEQIDVVKIMHCRNRREYRLPDLSRFCGEGYCPEARAVYEFFGCFYYGHTCKPFRDSANLRGDTLALLYEQMLSRFEQIMRT